MSYRRELRPLLRLAGPVVLAEIGWMSMGIVDTIMVGGLGPSAIGAAGMGTSIFTAIAIFGMGLMLGLDALVSRAHGAGRLEECVRWLHTALFSAVLLTPVVMALASAALATMDSWGLHPEVRGLAAPYLAIVQWSALPLLLYAALRRYLQGMHVVRPIMFALVSANIVNAAANWMLIHGNLGMPALGVNGAAWATVIARAYMAGFLAVAVAREHRTRGDAQPRVPFAVEPARIRWLVALGLPAALQVTLEVGVFAAVTALAARLDPVALASHQIALNIASVVFMVPLGLSSAGAVRVGHAIGARDNERAVHAGWTTLATGATFMSLVGLALFLVPAPLIRAFTTDPRVVEIGVGLLAIAAAFQLFDGTQAVATGVLRGIGNTRTPMLMNVIGHWVLGLPAGYTLCFHLGWGVSGLWIGLSIGLTLVAVVLTLVWSRHAAALRKAA